MSATGLLDQLTNLGLCVRAIDGRIRVEGPPGVLTNEHQHALAAKKSELLSLLQTAEGSTRRAPDPSFPERWNGGLQMDDETATVFARFAEHGTQAAWDDLAGAVQLEQRRMWCEEALEDAYTGRTTLAILPGGQLAVFPRGQAS